MTTAAASHVGTEFDDFLFASVGEDGNGMIVSLLSALARLDVDPWREAAELARLPPEAATLRLASLIAALPDRPSAHLASSTIAARLMALLPGRAGNVPSRETLIGIAGVNDSSALRPMIFVVVFFGFLMGAQFIKISRQPSQQVDSALAPPSSSVTRQILPKNSASDDLDGTRKY